MYDNIGGKIKSLSVSICIVEVISAIIGGIALIANDYGLWGVLTIIFGACTAWVSSWLLYGFGQLIENSDIIAEEYKRKNKKHEQVIAKSSERKRVQLQNKAKAAVSNPQIDEDVFIDIICPFCRAELSYPKEQLQSEEGVICPMCDAPLSL